MLFKIVLDAMQQQDFMLTPRLLNLIIILHAARVSQHQTPASTTVAPSHSSIPPFNCLPFLSIPLSFLSFPFVSFSSADLDYQATQMRSLSLFRLPLLTHSQRSPPTQCTLSRLKINTRPECVDMCVFLPCVYMNVYEVMCISQHSV